MGKADKDYFLDEHRQLTDDEAKAAFVLIRKGQEVPKEMADKYGIGKVAQPEEVAAEDTVTEGDSKEKTSEKAAKPSANKSAAPAENKE